jgi:hypothetical protein
MGIETKEVTSYICDGCGKIICGNDEQVENLAIIRYSSTNLSIANPEEASIKNALFFHKDKNCYKNYVEKITPINGHEIILSRRRYNQCRNYFIILNETQKMESLKCKLEYDIEELEKKKQWIKEEYQKKLDELNSIRKGKVNKRRNILECLFPKK